MHAFLLVGKNELERSREVEKMMSSLKVESKIFVEQTNDVYTVKSIRELNRDLSLKSPNLRAIVINNAQKMTEEAANAFLKTLEEPGEDTIYILTSPNRESVLETVASRCEVVNLGNTEVELTEDEKAKAIKDFEKLKKEVGERFKFVDKISDREQALQFVLGQIYAAREEMLHDSLFAIRNSQLLNMLLSAKKDLEQNVNVKLALTEVLLNY